MLTNNVTTIIVAIITVIGGILSTWLVIIYGKRRKKTKPFSVLESYEKLLKDQQFELERKSDIIDKLDSQIQQQAREFRQIIEGLRSELSDSRTQNLKLKTELESLKMQYGAS